MRPLIVSAFAITFLACSSDSESTSTTLGDTDPGSDTAASGDTASTGDATDSASSIDSGAGETTTDTAAFDSADESTTDSSDDSVATDAPSDGTSSDSTVDSGGLDSGDSGVTDVGVSVCKTKSATCTGVKCASGQKCCVEHPPPSGAACAVCVCFGCFCTF